MPAKHVFTRCHVRSLAGVALVAAALVGTGCSDDAGSNHRADHSTGVSSAKAEYLRQGNRLMCARSDRVMSAVMGAALHGRDLTIEEETKLARDRVLPAIRAAHDGLAALPVPDGETEAVSRLLGDMHDALVAAEANPAVVLGSDDPFAAVDRELAAYGLGDCV